MAILISVTFHFASKVRKSYKQTAKNNKSRNRSSSSYAIQNLVLGAAFMIRCVSIMHLCVSVADVFCSYSPPDAPGGGMRKWEPGNVRFQDQATYTCPKHAKFRLGDGSLAEEIVVECQWNASWSREQLPPCAGIQLTFNKKS